MSLSHQGGRRSWRVLSQLRQIRSCSPLPRPPSAHLGLQKFRVHGSIPIYSSSCLHHFYSSPSFSTAAHMENSADPEAIPSIDSVSEKHEAASSSAMALKLVDGEQEESIVKKMLEEHRELVSSLQAELDNQKTLTRSILDEIRLLKLDVDVKAAESKVAVKKQLWPEWTAFMEHLQSSGFFKDEIRAPSSDGGSVLEDPACVKRAVYKFSQAHNFVFESLSLIDLRIIARHGSTAEDPKAAASQKRLRQFFHIDDTSSDVSAAKPAFTQPKLSDVTRLLYSTVLEPTYGEEVKPSISHLLREIVTFSKKPSVVPPPAAETTLSSKLNATLSTAALDTIEEPKQEKEKHVKKEKVGDLRKIGAAKGEEVIKIAARSEARPVAAARAPEWKCPRCSFMNLDTKHRCVECSRRRPQRTYGSETVKSTDSVSLVDDDLGVKVPVEERQAKKALERKGTFSSPSTQGHERLKDRSSSSVIQEQDTTDAEDSCDEADIGSEGSESFSVLDDILDSEDSDDEQQEDSKVARLSDDSGEEEQANGKRATLSKLFPKLSSTSSRRDDQRGYDQRNGRKPGKRPSRGKRFEDDDDNRRSRYGSVGEDEQEGSEDDAAPPLRLGRGFGSRDDDYSRNPGRGGNNSFRGRGGRGYGGGRGDSSDGRRSDGGPRGASAYGDRDRGGRSSSYGSRPPSRKPRF